MKAILFALILTCIGLQSMAQQILDSELAIQTEQSLMMKQVMAKASSVHVDEILGYQNGLSNSLSLDMPRGVNRLTVVQEGDLNLIDFQAHGINNDFQFIQRGNSNNLQLANVQGSSNTLQVVQRGNGNQLIDRGSGLMNRPLRIEQSGGMKLIINGN